MNDLLSICIPTYNRCQYIEKILIEFIKQLEPYKIPIYISDNGSTDNTRSVIKNLEYEYLFYQNNKANTGIDQNIINAVKMASSQYVWIFSDDDLIADEAISKIMKILKHEYSLLIVNSSTYNKDFSKLLEYRHLEIDTDTEYGEKEYEKLLTDTASYSTFIGSLVISKKLWDSVDHKKFIGTDFVHSGIVFNYIIGKKAYFLSEPLIKIRLQNASWSNRTFEVWNINWPKIIWNLPSEYSRASKTKVTLKEPCSSIKTIAGYRAMGSYNRNLYFKYIKNNNNIPSSKKILLNLISIVPTIFLKRIKLLILYLKKPIGYKFKIFQLTNKI